MSQNRRLVLTFFYFFVAAFISIINLNAQTSSSPYSRYGIGDLNSTPFARNQAMGGIKYGLNQPFFINYANPASYANLMFTTFEVGSDFTQYWFNTDASEHRTNASQVVSYLDFAFPLKRESQKVGIGFGLEPYSKVGYSVTEVNDSSFDARQTLNYEGAGGLNNFHMGVGFKANKKLSFGLNIEYIFGTIENNRTVIYRNPYYMNSSLSSKTSVGWFHFTGGMQYRIDSLRFAKSDSIVMFEKKEVELKKKLNRLIAVKDSATNYERINETRQELAQTKSLKESVQQRKKKSDWKMVLGLVASPQADMHATNTNLVNSFRYASYTIPSLGTLYRDTAQSIVTHGDVRLPLSLGFGASMVKGTKWIVGADFNYQQWSEFRFLDVSDSLEDSWRVNVGAQFVPNDRALNAYPKWMSYRIGFYYQKGYIVLNDTPINDIGVTAGLAFPIRSSGTMVHFSAMAGQRGTAQNNLIRERYLRLTFGLTINDKWFKPTRAE